MPGTGKTATTLEIIRNLIKTQKNKFDFLHINAMSVTNPNLVYTIIHEKITGRRVNPTSAALFLDEYFKKKDKVPLLLTATSKNKSKKDARIQAERKANQLLIVLIDELDALITKKQTLLYNLFDWPCN
jgi:origin recognition complex subunit 1